MPELPVTELKKRPLARFQPKQFRKLIQGLGLEFRWSRAVPCTCALNSETDTWDPTCVRCGGNGFQYVNPDEENNPGITDLGKDYVNIHAVLSNLALDPKVQQPIGGWHFSDGMLTVQHEIRVGYRDRWVAINHEMAWVEELVRGSGLVVPVGKNQRTAEIQAQATRYEPIDVNFVAADDGLGTQTIYYAGTDYTITAAIEDADTDTYEPAKLTWVSGRGPATDQRYVVHYTCHPVWIVDDATYSIQGAQGPAEKLKGTIAARMLPTTFKVKLDYLTDQRGT